MSGRAPNVLWIVTTQWRAQATGYAGDPNARTPHLDALAAAAVNYEQAVTPHPFGPFARAALLTGAPCPGNGVRDYFDPLPITSRTIAHALRDRGYATAFFGKWHLAQRDPHAPLVGEAHARAVVSPAARGGFDFWEGFESGFLLNDPWLHGTRLAEPTRVAGYQSDILCARAGEWIQAEGAVRRPWFMLVSLEAPHPPYDAPAPGLAAPDPRGLILRCNVPTGAEIEAKARQELAGYYRHIAATDCALGGLLARAPERDTVVVVTSVHGDMHGSQGLFRKGWPHEESVRVPLLVRRPAESGPPPGMVDPGLVSLLDLHDWTLAWADGREPKAQNSKLETALQRLSMPSVVALPQQCDRAWRGVRTAARKLILQPDGSPWLFFNLERDPFEQHNLAKNSAHAAELARWQALV